MSPCHSIKSTNTMSTDASSPLTREEYSTQAYCLFCYKLIISFKDNLNNLANAIKHQDAERYNQKNERMAVSTRIYKHIAVNAKNIRGEKCQVQSKNCGVCDDCWHVVESYYKSYQEIEYLKLRLRWQLETLHKVMKFAGKVPSRIKAFKESFQKNANDDALKDITAFRQTFYEACSKKLQSKNPRVVLNQLETVYGDSAVEIQVSTKVEVTQDTTIAHEALPLREIELGDTDNTNCDDHPQSEDPNIVDTVDDRITFILKSEDDKGSNDNDDFQRITTPPESIIETLRSGKVPVEGALEHHYIFVTRVSPTTVNDEDSVPGSPLVNENVEKEVELVTLDSPNVPENITSAKDNRSEECDIDQLMGEPNSSSTKNAPEGDYSSQNQQPSSYFKCIKCTQTFPSEDLLIQHAREGSCFSNENINLNYRASSDLEQNNSSSSKRKRSSLENSVQHCTTKRSKSSCDKMVSSALPTEKIKESGSKPTNIISSVLNKVLSQSFFKCPNCSETFSREEKFKGHMIARECFTKSKTRTATGSKKENNNACLDSDDSNHDSDTSSSSLSTSSHEEDSDSDKDFYPARGRDVVNGKKIKNKRTLNSRKKVSKQKCPDENCGKFFLYEEELKRHLKQHDNFSCKFCSFTSTVATIIVNHEIQNHSKMNTDGDIICPRCPGTKVLKSDKNYQTDHFIRKHLSNKSGKKDKETYLHTQCKLCSSTFRSKLSANLEYSLKRHMKKAHSRKT